jgi:hypothetical protein
MTTIRPKSRLLRWAVGAGWLLLLSEGTAAVPERQQKEPTENREHAPTSLAILPKMTLGFLVGRAADTLGGSKNTSIIGGGLGIEYSPGLRSHFGLNTELVYGQSHQVKFNRKNGRVRSLSFSGSWLVRFSVHNPRSFYARTSFGFSRLKDENPGVSGSLTPAFLRLGLGHSHRGGTPSETRFELYYKRLFTSGLETKPEYARLRLLFDVEYIGVELSMSFSVL